MKRLNELYNVDSDVLIKGISINSNDILSQLFLSFFSTLVVLEKRVPF